MSRTVVRVQPFVFRHSSAPASRSSRLPMAWLTPAITHGADHSGPVNQLDYPIGLTRWIKTRTVSTSDVSRPQDATAHRRSHDQVRTHLGRRNSRAVAGVLAGHIRIRGHRGGAGA